MCIGKEIDVLIGWPARLGQLETLFLWRGHWPDPLAGFLSADASSTGCIRSFT